MRNGKPLGGFPVTLRPEFGGDPDLATRRGATDERGEAVFVELPAGAYAVAADYGAAKPAEIKVDAETTVELVVAGGFDVEGEVVDDADEKPVPYAEIYLDGARRMSRVPTARADAEGRFRLVGLPAGHVNLIAVGAMRSSGDAWVLGGERDLVRARVVCGAEAGDVEVRCVDEGGKPMGGAEIMFEFGDDGGDAWTAHASALDSAGTARFAGVAAGHVYVRGKTSDGRVADGAA